MQSHWRWWELCPSKESRIWPKVVYSLKQYIYYDSFQFCPGELRQHLKWVHLINIFCLKPWLPAANTKQSTMPLPCQPCSAAPEARAKVIPTGEVFLPSLAGSPGSQDPGRVLCRVSVHEPPDPLEKKGKSTTAPCMPASPWVFPGLRYRRVAAESSAQQRYGTRRDPKQEAWRKAAQNPKWDHSFCRTLVASPLITVKGPTLQINGWKRKSFVTRSQKAWPETHRNWWECFYWFSGFILLKKFSHLRVRCSFWQLNP